MPGGPPAFTSSSKIYKCLLALQRSTIWPYLLSFTIQTKSQAKLAGNRNHTTYFHWTSRLSFHSKRSRNNKIRAFVLGVDNHKYTFINAVPLEPGHDISWRLPHLVFGLKQSFKKYKRRLPFLPNNYCFKRFRSGG